MCGTNPCEMFHNSCISKLFLRDLYIFIFFIIKKDRHFVVNIYNAEYTLIEVSRMYITEDVFANRNV